MVGDSDWLEGVEQRKESFPHPVGLGVAVADVDTHLSRRGEEQVVETGAALTSGNTHRHL